MRAVPPNGDRANAVDAVASPESRRSGTDHKNGWDILGVVKSRIWSFAPSIIQADNEGFTNEDGYHILWQFSDSAAGDWSMGILRDGQWKHFQMDLGNRKQRESFLQGQVPDGAKRI